MDKLYGTESVLLHRNGFDRYGLTTYGEIINSRASVFILKCLKRARNYDIIHVHSLFKIVPFLKVLYDKPVIIHFHGSDIRDKWKSNFKWFKRADRILVSTEGLLFGAPDNSIWIPNPVNTERFKHRDPNFVYHKDCAFTFSYGADDEARRIANKFNWNLDIIPKGIPHKDLAEFMAKYEFYIDLKRDFKGRLLPLKGIPSLSKTALEALSVGLKVIAKDGKIREGLPDRNRPENVVKVIYDIYEDLLKS